MKVLFINTVYKNGGSTGRIVYDLRNQLLKSEKMKLMLYMDMSLKFCQMKIM